jgi:hypothetical protein
MNVKKYSVLFRLTFLIITGAVCLTSCEQPVPATVTTLKVAKVKKIKGQRAIFARKRIEYEFEILKDPETGRVPLADLKTELSIARGIPERIQEVSPFARILTNNTYMAAGPDNIGGRTRAVAYDKRFGTGGNQVIIAGSVSGGIHRSTDGGANWQRVTPENELHNVTALAQDTRAGFENTWYAGGGEALGNTASGVSAFYLGFGILKSTDNGANWTRLTQVVTDVNGSQLGTGTLETFDNPFDIVHKIIVHPLNGHVYISGNRRLVRSTNGGTSFNVVFAGAVSTSSDLGQMDVVVSSTGRLFLSVNGGNPDLTKRGVWKSETGDLNSWVRFAGGQTPGTDSLAGWRAEFIYAN